MKVKFILMSFLFWSYTVKGQTKDTIVMYPETVVIKVIESNSFGITNNIDSKMIIVDDNNKTIIKDLKRINFNKDLNDGLEDNTEKLRLELQVWNNKGFVVKSASSVAPRDYIIITTIILQKN
jgi:hypothetical protein